LHPWSLLRVPNGPFAVWARPPAPYDEGFSRFLRQETGATRRKLRRRFPRPSRPGSSTRESGPLEPADVVAEPDEEEHQHEGEADHAGALHHLERDRPPAPDLLRQRPEDVPAV